MLRLIALATLIATSAAAQQVLVPCRIAPYKTYERHLSETYGEAIRHSGLIGTDMVMEVWRNDDTGGWTILLLRPDGSACALAAGEHWQDWAERPEPDGEPM